MLEHTLVFIILYCRNADFLKKADFLQICICKETGQLYCDAVNIKNVSDKSIHTFCKIILLRKSPWACVFIYIRIDKSTLRNIERSPTFNSEIGPVPDPHHRQAMGT